MAQQGVESLKQIETKSVAGRDTLEKKKKNNPVFTDREDHYPWISTAPQLLYLLLIVHIASDEQWD
mgnify:CR=1 FL=1